MADRAKLWQRVCTACGMLDGSYALIAVEDGAEARLAAEPWACPTCGVEDYLAARRMEDGDLDDMVGDNGRRW
jgi:hypothetical protein